MTINEKMFLTDYRNNSALYADFVRRQNAEYFKDQRESSKIDVYQGKDGFLIYSIQRPNQNLVRQTTQKVFDCPCSSWVIKAEPAGNGECIVLKFGLSKILYLEDFSNTLTVKHFKKLLMVAGVSVCCTSRMTQDVLSETLVYLFEMSPLISLPMDIGWSQKDGANWIFVSSNIFTYERLMKEIREGNFSIFYDEKIAKIEGEKDVCKRRIVFI